MRVHLALLIHAHQPVGNFDSVLEEIYGLAYRPFIEELQKHPGVRVAFHYSGILLEWLENRHPDYLDHLRALVEAGQVEMTGGGYYEPVLSAIPERDRQAQLERMSEYLERRFGRRPRGIWLTERVWDPSLPQTLARAGIDYTLTDDQHFLSAGLEEDQLYGYYLTEWQGSAVKVIPGLKKLRYLLPFRMEYEVVGFLRRVGEQRDGALAAMGDDLEKFGAWPETHQHVYTDGWLRRFFEALEETSDWLQTCLPGRYVMENQPLGRIYLPTGSYQEMMEWALPAGAGAEYQALLGRVSQMPDGERLSRFVHGGVWHNFFHKYEEANHLHKRMLDLSRRFEQAGAGQAGYEKLLEAQCNDAYWHGVFGGLYAPHLRAAVYRALIEAENAFPVPVEARRLDFNLDGREEVLLSNQSLGVILAPGDGGVAAEIDYRPRAFNVINSLGRRPEAYHERLRGAGRHQEGARSIHDRVRSKEQGLERHLLFDRYQRHAFRSLVFAAGRNWEDYRLGRLEESEELAAGAFEVLAAEPLRCLMRGRARSCLCEVRTEIRLEGSAVAADWELRQNSMAELRGGLELVLNLLAPDAHDRYFLLPGVAERPRLGWGGETSGECLSLVDEWTDLRIDIRARPPATWWVFPIYTVSQSEAGFEKVYQGSAILPHWPVTAGLLEAQLRLQFGPAR